MMVYDPIYGPFLLPEYLNALVDTPEVRRLSQIRLLNTVSTSLATLGEVRRFSHTLGVVYLATQTTLLSYSEAERRAFVTAALLHDIGTAPFAHLFEYHLKELTGWNHEDEIRKVLTGTHAPENTAHQIFHGRTIGLSRAFRKAGVDRDIVLDIVGQKHPLATLLFGTLDLDNLDNIARMSWCLGLGDMSSNANVLAAHLRIGASKGTVELPISERSHVIQWAKTRRRIYEILVFDAATVAAQATLSAAIKSALETKALTALDWTLTDEELLTLLSRDRDTKHTMANEFFGSLPRLLFSVQLPGGMAQYPFRTRDQACKLIEQAIEEAYPRSKPLGYSFEDKGTFEKAIDFRDPDTQEEWSVGTTSRSVVLYGFVRSKQIALSGERTAKALDVLADSIGLPREQVKILSRDVIASDHEQRTFNFAT